MTGRTLSETVTSRFFDYFNSFDLQIVNQLPQTSIRGNRLEMRRKKNENLSSSADDPPTTA